MVTSEVEKTSPTSIAAKRMRSWSRFRRASLRIIRIGRRRRLPEGDIEANLTEFRWAACAATRAMVSPGFPPLRTRHPDRSPGWGPGQAMRAEGEPRSDPGPRAEGLD